MARWCASAGWPVHPLTPRQKTPAANCDHCREDRHNPADCSCIAGAGWCHGFHAATTSHDRIDAWWTTNPRFGVGVSCGPADLVVIDVDAHHAEVPHRRRLLPGIAIGPQVTLTGLATGFDTLALLAALRHRPSPADDETTLRVRTPSGGLHIWYRNKTPEIRYRSSTGSSPKTALAWQVDVRSDGGYIVGPATRTTAGTYLPVGPARMPAPLPSWLAAELTRTGHVVSSRPAESPAAVPVPRTPRRRAHKAAERILEPLLQQVTACGAVPQGVGFTEKLNRAAYTAGGLVRAGHLAESEARTLLQEAANRARPGQEHRILVVIDSALSAGAQHPFHPKGRS
ncbi:bifunctional DNA primase/polymerase [Streptomyces sp. NBC_01728]|uniref:bifunctional DNA primase/polymerase n=1 Tax=unclassified Streptomyces TaxID=2593676 RepID=UPI00225927AF|nr:MULTISPECIES: bifunctional DNA primase/polymerase [unclassified Streptomyces]MCX4460712.1 bifunctional DNA primase/polymerase [Streptomyces sp. NBC_01719]MCX4499958.1 bifunctional DNA primase/polymerase [Streptomyces sp. NBC_01728]